ncbi:uncharacterized protein LOC130808538 [Amaranthus tricolor]|uniref:uncharacterized protein LOC130808538 n=1 Tax=Amaranthus tricolor TaxID=29722 RepID=UPI0025859973|nr:uncharacterized protein LOC130808538 [Amaranthus tricolor]
MRHISIIKSEGLEISQPALDPVKSVVHHTIIASKKNGRENKRIRNSWVEIMAPVFSKAAWQCVWYMMIQNDQIHAWGLDRQYGYCAEGDRTKNVGVVDSEYVVHLGLSTLAVLEQYKVRRQSYIEMKMFGQRWNDATKNAECWIDIYQKH